MITYCLQRYYFFLIPPKKRPTELCKTALTFTEIPASPCNFKGIGRKKQSLAASLPQGILIIFLPYTEKLALKNAPTLRIYIPQNYLPSS